MSKKSKKIKLYNILDCVPYQVCPYCTGSGRNIVDAFKQDAHYGNDNCPVCKGSRIIPMHIVETTLTEQATAFDGIFKKIKECEIAPF